MGTRLVAVIVIVFVAFGVYAQIDTTHQGRGIAVPENSILDESTLAYKRFHENILIYGAFGEFNGNAFRYRNIDYSFNSGRSAGVGVRVPIVKYVALQGQFGIYDVKTRNGKTVADTAVRQYSKYSSFSLGVGGLLIYPHRMFEPYLSAGISFNVNNIHLIKVYADNSKISERNGGFLFGANIGAGLRVNVWEDIVVGLGIERSFNIQRLKEGTEASDFGGTTLRVQIGMVL